MPAELEALPTAVPPRAIVQEGIARSGLSLPCEKRKGCLRINRKLSDLEQQNTLYDTIQLHL